MAHPCGNPKVKHLGPASPFGSIPGKRESMSSGTSDGRQYTKQLLDLYRHTPGTLAQVRREDRRLALLLYHRGIPLGTVEEAFLLATARRSFRDLQAAPLSPIRSLHYFVPVIDELLATPLPAGYVDYLKRKLRTFTESHHNKTTLPSG